MPGDRPRAVILPEPGVSWINLPSQHYRGPEQRSRRLPKSLSRIQHGYGTERRVEMSLTPGQIALQRKPAHPQVPASGHGGFMHLLNMNWALPGPRQPALAREVSEGLWDALCVRR